MERTRLTDPALAKAIDAAIAQRGLSRRQVALETGIPFTTLTRRLTGNSSFTVAEVQAIGELVGQSLSELLREAAAAA